MDWNAIGAIGEIGGTAAVVITLIYLARQTRANTKAIAYAIAGFIHSCPAWRKAFDEWKAGGGIDAGLVAAIEQVQPNFPDIVTAQRGER